MTKRVLAFLMVIAMVFSLIPTVVVAVEAETPAAFEVILQKSHNQTSATGVDVDIYLQAAAAAEVTAIQLRFTKQLAVVASHSGMQGTEVALDEENNAIEPATLLAYAPVDTNGNEWDPIAVGTGRILLATVNAASVEDVAVAYAEVTVEAGFYTTDAEATGEGYLGAVAVETLAYACADHECGHGEGTWSEFALPEAGEDGNYDLAGGKYFLTADVTLAGALGLAAEGEAVTICLNGYSITGDANDAIVAMDKAGTFNICDCTATVEGAAYTAGKLIPNKIKHGGVFRVENGIAATINMYGGVADGTALDGQAEGSMARIEGGGTLNLLGGKVVGFDGLSNVYGIIVLLGTNPTGEKLEVTNARIEDVTFANCSQLIVSAPSISSDGNAGHAKDDAVNLVVKDVTVTGSAAGSQAIHVSDGNFASVSIEGNCDFDAPVYITKGEELTLNLGENADINIVTEAELTEEQFNTRVKMAEGGSLTAGTVLYETAGLYVTYDAQTGLFAFEDAHYIADKHAVDEKGNKIAFKPWEETDSLPREGNWYLVNNVNVSGTVDLGKTLNLDLNGKTITSAGQRVYNIYMGTLNLYDGMSEYDKDGNWVSAGDSQATITGYNTNNAGCITMYTGGTFNLYSGKFSGNSGNNGAVLYMYATHADRTQNGAVFNMYGGEITGNTGTTYGIISAMNPADVKEGKERGKINIYGGKIYSNTGTADGTIRSAGNTDITMTGGEISGNTAKNGGAFYLDGDTDVTISNVEICNNTATSLGGAVYITGTSELTATNVKVNGNTANYGGAIVMKKNTATVTFTGGQLNYNTCTLSGDYAGGAVLFMDVSATASFTNVEMKGNSATNCSGGVIQQNFSGTVTLTNCTITENSSGKIGSVIFARGSSGTPVFNLNNTVITGNTSGNTEGAVYVQSKAVLRLSGSTVIAGNLNKSGKNTTTSDLHYTDATRTNYIQVNELADGAHVNVYNDNATELAATDLVKMQSGKTQTDWECGWITYFYKNAATSRNVARRDIDGTKTFTYGHWHTDANGNEYELQPWVDDTGAAKTTTLPTSGNYYLTANVAVTAATTVSSGDVELCTNGYKISTTKEVRMYTYKSSGNMSIVNCTAGYNQNGHLVAGSEISGFHTGSNGGVFNTTGATGVLTLSGLEFKNCYDKSTYNYEDAYGYGGGVIQSRDGNGLVVDGCNFIGCHSGSTGGAINIRHGGTWKARTITNCVFKNNYAGAAGGAIYALGNKTDTVLTIENCIFDGNYATTINDSTDTAAEFAMSGHGGAVFIKNITANVTNSEFTGNYNKHRDGLTTNADTCRGGAIYVYNNKTTALNVDKDETTSTSFTDNTSVNLGGAIWVGDPSTIHNAVFTGNSAPNGGAIYGYDKITLKKATFMENEASAAGGAVYSLSPLTLTTCTFTENAAATFGGAVYDGCSGTVNITGCDFTLNSAANGGAAYVTNNSMTLNVTDTDFTGNTATSNGGALDAEFTSTANIKGCSFDGNTAGSLGGAIVTRGKDMTMTIAKNDSGVACTFTNNTANKGGALAFDTYNGNANTRYVNDAVFTDNTATSGGAIYTCSGSPTDTATGHCVTTITNGTFTGNKAHDGSAISANNFSETILDSCSITGNESTSAGYGAIFVQNENTILTLQGMMDISGNTNASTSNLDADLWLNVNNVNGVELYGAVTVGELTVGSTIGVNANANRYEKQPVIGTVTATGDVSDYFFSNNPDLFVVGVNADKELVLTKYVDESGNTYDTVADAITGAANNGDTEFTFQAGTTETVTVPEQITKVDLNGRNIAKITVPAEKTLTLIDSATNGYDAVEGEFGKVKVVGNVESYAVVNNNGTKRYLVIENGDGTVSAHRVYLAINSKLLRPYTYGAGFRAIFAGDETVAKNVKFGIQLYGEDIDLETESKVKATFEGMTAGIEGTSTPNQKTVAITNAITEEDKSNWTDVLCGEPFMELNGETYTGIEQKLVMKTMAQAALEAVEADSDTAKYINKMIEKFELDIA